MPVYEYVCEKCGHEFEVSQRITEEPIKTCPSCRARRVKRLISQTSFVLKGSGWYSDLYSSGKGKDKDKEADKTDSGSASESTEKPAAKSGDAKESGGDAKPKKKDSGSKGKGKKKSSRAAA